MFINIENSKNIIVSSGIISMELCVETISIDHISIKLKIKT